MTQQIMLELNDSQMETISGGHHKCHNNFGSLMSQLRHLLHALGAMGGGSITNTNTAIVIIANSTINAPLNILINQSI